MASQNNVITRARRVRLARITSGAISTIPKITHVALVDEEGSLCAVRNTTPKTKDSDEQFMFVFDDEF